MDGSNDWDDRVGIVTLVQCVVILLRGIEFGIVRRFPSEGRDIDVSVCLEISGSIDSLHRHSVGTLDASWCFGCFTWPLFSGALRLY